MNYKIGRNNLAATIYVPYDCKNNCPFCTSKKEYAQLKLDEDAVKEALRKLVTMPEIKDIVFTGGEPTANPRLLAEMVEIARYKNVYINTTLPKENFFECLEIFNGGHVNGVNISRHFDTFAKDSRAFYDIVDDWNIKGIQVPVKINIVLSEKTSIPVVENCINRWKNNPNVTVCFRRDFRKVTPENLHVLYSDPILDWLIENHEFANHTFCDVCDTVTFKDRIAFHRGLQHSSVQIGNTVIVNDIIVFPDGFIAYDWDRKPISNLDNFLPKSSRNHNASYGYAHNGQVSVSSCGGSGGCGVSRSISYSSCGGSGRC